MGVKRMETPRKLTSRSGKRFFLHKGRIGVIYLGRGKMAWLLRTPQWEKKLYCQKLKILVKTIKCQPWKLRNRSHRSILRHNKNHISLNKMQNMITLLSFQCQSLCAVPGHLLSCVQEGPHTCVNVPRHEHSHFILFQGLDILVRYDL